MSSTIHEALNELWVSRRAPSRPAMGWAAAMLFGFCWACGGGSPEPPTMGGSMANGGGSGASPGSGGAGMGAPASGGNMMTATGGAGSGKTIVAGPSDRVLYPKGQLHSPITSGVASWLREIAATNPANNPKNFIKIGDAICLGLEYMGCFGEGGTEETLADFSQLKPTIDYFKGGSIKGTDPFLRQSDATRENLTALDALMGRWVEEELMAASPTYALLMFGGVDIGNGGTFEPDPFYDSYKATEYAQPLWEITDQLIASGVVPLLRNMAPRARDGKLVPQLEMFSAIARGIAQGRQVPFVDFYSEIVKVPDYGLEGDGLHITSFMSGGQSARCVLTAEGLMYGYNIMNRLSLEQLDRARRVIVGQEPMLDAAGGALSGEGTVAMPFEVPALPFTDMRSRADAQSKVLSSYSACQGGMAQGGEYVYRFEVQGSVKARAVLINKKGSPSEAKLFHFTSPPSNENCANSDEVMLPLVLGSGTHYFVVDGPNTTEPTAELLFLLAECDPLDPTCK